MLAELEERALVARGNRGEASALEALYRAYNPWVLTLARRFTGNPDDAMDVLQETFISLFSRFPGFKLTSTLRSYLYPVVKHHAIDLLRRRRRLLVDSEIDLGFCLPDEAGGDFARLLGRLSPEHRDVATLRFGLDFKLDEIAAALAIPLGTVKSRLHNALKALGEREKREAL